MIQDIIKTPYYYRLLEKSSGTGLFKKKTIHAFPLVKLEFIKGKKEIKGKHFYIYNINPPDNPKGEVIIGRKKPEGNKAFIHLQSEEISRDPTIISYQDGSLMIETHSLKTRILVDRKKIRSNKKILLQERSLVTMGDTEFKIHLLYAKKVSPSEV